MISDNYNPGGGLFRCIRLKDTAEFPFILCLPGGSETDKMLVGVELVVRIGRVN